MSEVFFTVEESASGFTWKLVTQDGRVIAVGAEEHPTREACLEAIEKVQRSSGAHIRDVESG